MLSPLPGCRCAAFSLGLGLTLATSASAQTFRGPEVPCDMPLFRLGDFGTGGALGDWGPSVDLLEARLKLKAADWAARFGTDQLTLRSWLGDLEANPLPVVAGPRRDHHSYLWRVGLSWTHATPDAFEGNPSGVDGTRVDLLTLEIARSFWTHRERISQFGIRIPHVRLRIPGSYGVPGASGMGDATLFLDLHLPRKNESSESPSSDHGATWPSHRFISVDATLPTGDEDELLGIGEPLVRLGVQGMWRRVRKVAPASTDADASTDASMDASASMDAEDAVAAVTAAEADQLLIALFEHHLSRRSGGPRGESGLKRQDSEGGPPDLEISLGLAYLHDFRDEELSHLELASSVILRWDRLDWESGVALTHELGDGPSGGGRDEATQLDLLSELRIQLKRRGEYRGWHLNVGARTRLTDDGLSDRFTPTIGLVHLLN